MTCFLDSDIILDVILVRPPFFNDSSSILEMSGTAKIDCCTTVHCLLNVHYMSKKHFGEQNARKAIKVLTERLKVVAEHEVILREAIDSEFGDLEDAMQYFAALTAKADVIITRNIKDYKHSTIPVLTAEQFLSKIL